MAVPSRDITRIALGVGAFLLLPLALTLFNANATIYGGPGGGWDWMPGDFVFMGVLLFVTGFAIDFAVRNISSPAIRVIAVAAIVAALLAVWVEAAVDGVSQLITFLLS
jgi:hypothetical protein